MRRCRVIHCGTGIAGKQALRAIIDHPHMELVGLLIHSEANAGKDAGELAGLDKTTGVKATCRVDDIVALEADVVCHMLLIPDVDIFEKLLASGKNVVSTSGMVHPSWGHPEAHARLEAACKKGNATLHVTGINPGWVDETLPLAMTMMSRDIEHIHIREYADCAQYPAPHILNVMGFGKTPEELASGAVPDMAVMRDYFTQSVASLAHGLGVTLDDIVETRDLVLTPTAYDIKAGHIPANTIAGQRWRWSGILNGRERIVQETYWITAFDLGEGWPESGAMENDTQWQVTIEGSPSLRCVFEPRYSFARAALGTEDYNPSGMATAMAAVNRLHDVVNAAPGIAGSGDLAQPRGYGTLRP